MHTLAHRDAERLAAASSLPLHVRYPKQYTEEGTREEYEIDEEVGTARAAVSVLQRLIDQAPRPQNPEDDELELLASRGSYRSTSRSRNTLVIQVCPEVHADGTYKTVQFTFQLSRRRDSEVRAIEVGWESFR